LYMLPNAWTLFCEMSFVTILKIYDLLLFLLCLVFIQHHVIRIVSKQTSHVIIPICKQTVIGEYFNLNSWTKNITFRFGDYSCDFTWLVNITCLLMVKMLCTHWLSQHNLQWKWNLWNCHNSISSENPF
jgi:hypothetical protein